MNSKLLQYLLSSRFSRALRLKWRRFELRLLSSLASTHSHNRWLHFSFNHQFDLKPCSILPSSSNSYEDGVKWHKNNKEVNNQRKLINYHKAVILMTDKSAFSFSLFERRHRSRAFLSEYLNNAEDMNCLLSFLKQHARRSITQPSITTTAIAPQPCWQPYQSVSHSINHPRHVYINKQSLFSVIFMQRALNHFISFVSCSFQFSVNLKL